MAKIDELFRYLKDSKGSDLHLMAGRSPRSRIHGTLVDIEGWDPLSNDALKELMREICSAEQWKEYEASGDLDFAYSLKGVARFRVNFLSQHRGAAAIFRIIPEKILGFDDLGAPDAVRELANLEQGLVLITGPTGSGKSTTLAAIISAINHDYAKHIVTIEDPVEFIHPNRKSVLSQREVKHDTASFGDALKVAIRQDADVILVGEMRDLETIELAITAAEMGTLVFGTLHTNSATKTIDRLIDAFPANQQSQIRTSVADSIKAIVSQLLLPTADGKGRCAAYEILLRTNSLAKMIREGNTTMLLSIIQSHRNQGMCTMDDSLMDLLDENKITNEAAWAKVHNRDGFEQNRQLRQSRGRTD